MKSDFHETDLIINIFFIMDELKLNVWQQRFTEEVQTLETAFAAFFQRASLKTYYQLSLDSSHELSLQINDGLPQEIKARLVETFLATKPEDSI